MLARALEELMRREGARLTARLIRRTGRFDIAEDALQDACAAALRRWPLDGVPDKPEAWLWVAATRRAVDLLRAERRLAGDDDTLEGLAAAPDFEPGPENDWPDDRLRLIFTCCHPALAPSAQVALALRTLCGLSTREIARAFVEPETTTAQKLVRAQRKIAEAGIPFVVPGAADMPVRLSTVLATIYFVFNEGYAASHRDHLLRPDLTVEAIRLGELVAELLPDQPEAAGLLCLMRLHDARRAARVDAAGHLVPLEEQDRSLWDRAAIAAADERLKQVLAARRPGPYQVQAAIAALHATAPEAAATDWQQIAALYRALLAFGSTPVVELNAAVALAMSGHLDEGLAWIDRLADGPELDHYPLLHAARADLLRRSGSTAAAAAYRRAIELTRNGAERAYLERRLAEVGGG